MAGRAWVAGALLVAAAVAGCSRTESPSVATTTSSAPTTPSSAASGTTAAPGTTAPSTGTTVRTPGTTTPGGSTSSPDPEAAEFCTVVKDNQTVMTSGFGTLDSAKAMVPVLKDLVEVAPPSQKTNAETMARVGEGLAGASSEAEFQAATNRLLTDPEFMAAATSLEDYMGTQCGVHFE